MQPQATKASLSEDARELKHLDPYIGHLSLDAIHRGILQHFIKDRKHRGKRKEDSGQADRHPDTITNAIFEFNHVLNISKNERCLLSPDTSVRISIGSNLIIRTATQTRQGNRLYPVKSCLDVRQTRLSAAAL